MIGRAYLYGLGAGGLQGVAKAIEIIRNELDVSMALTGITSVAAAGPQMSLPAAASKRRAGCLDRASASIWQMEPPRLHRTEADITQPSATAHS